MDREERASYHALTTALLGDYRKLKKLRESHGSWRAALEREHGGDIVAAIRACDTLTEQGIVLLLNGDPDFPRSLREIPWSPFALYMRGAPLTAEELCVAIVGTRNATREGKRFAAKIAHSLAETNLTVVSGLALGIDAAAQGAVAEGGRRTIAVLGGGVDTIYPRTNERIGMQILEAGGSLISEYPPGTPPLPRRFIERNRIISGLAKGVVVIEAPRKSGSLATATFALEQNREVLVAPGFPEHPNYEGSHALIRAGAYLITSADDVREALGMERTSTRILDASFMAKLDADEKAIINVLMSSATPMDLSAIAEATNLDLPVVGATLGSLVVQDILTDNLGTFTVKQKSQ